jgi:hypothetical protein
VVALEQQHGFSIDGVAFREKDRNCVAALLDAQLVDSDVITTRLRSVPGTQRVATGRAWQPSDGRAGHQRVFGHQRLHAPVGLAVDHRRRSDVSHRVVAAPSRTGLTARTSDHEPRIMKALSAELRT